MQTNFDRRSRPFLMKKLKKKKFSDNASFLGYKVNINVLTKTLQYSHISGTKMGVL